MAVLASCPDNYWLPRMILAPLKPLAMLFSLQRPSHFITSSLNFFFLLPIAFVVEVTLYHIAGAPGPLITIHVVSPGVPTVPAATSAQSTLRTFFGSHKTQMPEVKHVIIKNECPTPVSHMRLSRLRSQSATWHVIETEFDRIGSANMLCASRGESQRRTLLVVRGVLEYNIFQQPSHGRSETCAQSYGHPALLR